MMGKVINFGSRKPVWIDSVGNKFKFEVSDYWLKAKVVRTDGTIRTPLMWNTNGAVLNSSGFFFVATSYAIRNSNGFFIGNTNYVLGFASMSVQKITSTVDNGDETFIFSRTLLGANKWINTQTINSNVSVVVKEFGNTDDGNHYVTLTRSDGSGEEVEVHILIYSWY